MSPSKQRTNDKRGPDHVASDRYKRANRWAAFLPQDIFQVDVVEGGYAKLTFRKTFEQLFDLKR